MRVLLKFSAYANRQLFPAGVVENWPDGVKLPSTARELKEAEVVEAEVEEVEKEPDTLSELQKKGTSKK